MEPMKKHECQKRKDRHEELAEAIREEIKEFGYADVESLTYEYSERFCLNSKCTWHGHRADGKEKLCPICGYATCFYSGNDGFFMHGHVPKKIYPKPDYPEDYEPYDKPINLDTSYRLQTNSSTLPLNYMYYGMDKIKAGKGYDKQGHPIGVISAPCKECDGNIISIKMNTSSKGFETTSEKVCDTCGLTVPGSFQTLEPREEYRTPPNNSHQEWLDQNKPSFDLDDVDMELERWANWNGYRANTEDSETYGDQRTSHYINPRYVKRLKDAEGRLDNTPASKKMPMQKWREKEYHLIADDYIHMLGLNKLDAADVHYYINEYGVNYKKQSGTYRVDDIISHLCLVIKFKSIKPQKFSVFIREYKRYNKYNRVLYQLIKEKLV